MIAVQASARLQSVGQQMPFAREQCDEYSSWQMAQVLLARSVGKTHQQVPVLRVEEGGNIRAHCIVCRLRITVSHRRNIASIGGCGWRVAHVRSLSAHHFHHCSLTNSVRGFLPTIPIVLATVAVRREGPSRLILGKGSRGAGGIVRLLRRQGTVRCTARRGKTRGVVGPCALKMRR